MAEKELFKVTLGDYTGLKLKREKVIVPKKELDEVCRREAMKFSQMLDVTDRPVKMGDIVTLDFTGYIDGRQFDGGTGDDYPLEIGSGTFIPGFEEQLIGASVGDEPEVNIKFPRDYPAPNLAGKDAVFECRINKIEEMHVPELDENVRDDIRRQLREQKEQDAETEYENKLLAMVVENSTIDLKDSYIERELDVVMREWTALMQARGIDPEAYFHMTGQTEFGLRDEFRPKAEGRLRMRLTLEAVASEQGFEADEFEVEKLIDEIARSYNSTREMIKPRISDEQMEGLRSDVRMRRAINYIKEHAIDEE